ncbi:crystallin J1 [Xylanimonas allomyrinae]|uniref:Crystallin J1 n=1 Tax=Xylanimonas allomyrinae TaxID=2509459 RepID=A0A4P6ENC5_9MICO|nr:ADP-ribosylglycohydrolase family protein [Xylanimonas allomyrinae]QAY62809.1 crystallin J1 [Xylanimonas allomyrinae]
MTPPLRKRIHGAVIGQAIGDALGAPTEGMTRAQIRERWGRVSGFLAADPAGTDDTEYAALTALTLLKYGTDLTSADVAREWHDALVDQATPFDGGGFSEMEAIHNLERGLRPPASGTDGHEQWSDGSAMRVAPIGAYAAGDPGLAARLAAVDAAVSHARDGIWCGQAIAAATAVAIEADGWSQVVEAAVAATPADSWSRRMLVRAVDIAQGSGSDEERLDELERRISLSHYPWADTAPEATALALGVFAVAEGGYVDSVLGGVNIGRDADTIAAMAGALAGALHGVDAIPGEWTRRLGPLRGSCVAAMAGVDLGDLADRISDAVETRRATKHA